LLPQSGNQTRFVDAADILDRIKACHFFKYATSARSRSFSLRKACAESVMAALGGTGLRCSFFILDVGADPILTTCAD
jgi:hypothetical protein